MIEIKSINKILNLADIEINGIVYHAKYINGQYYVNINIIEKQTQEIIKDCENLRQEIDALTQLMD